MGRTSSLKHLLVLVAWLPLVLSSCSLVGQTLEAFDNLIFPQVVSGGGVGDSTLETCITIANPGLEQAQAKITARGLEPQPQLIALPITPCSMGPVST